MPLTASYLNEFHPFNANDWPRYFQYPYDNRIPGKLAPYESYVINMRAKGRTYKEIHDFITEKGYAGTVASLRMFMQKERTHQKEASKAASADNSEVEYIQRKSLCKLIYSKLEDVTMLTGEQYNAAIQKYPILGKMYSLVKGISSNNLFP